MFSTAVVVGVAGLALLIGMGAGWFLGSQRRPAHRDAIQELEARLEQAIEERSGYESEVRNHFSRTAELLNRLTEDYRSVYQHIATGADQLCDGEVVVPADALAPPDSDEIPPQLVDVQQPLDYAPRKSPDEQGQLSEDFGLEKASELPENSPARASV